MMKNLRASYRNFSWGGKFLVVGLVVAIVAAFSFRYDYNILISVAVTISLSLLVDLVLRTPKSLLVGLVGFSQICSLLFMLWFLQATFEGTYFASMGLQTVVTGVVFIFSVLITFLAVLFSHNRLWVTLLASFSVLNLTAFLPLALFNNIPIVLSITIGGLLGCGVVWLRSINFSNKVADKLVADKSEELSSVSALNYVTTFLDNEKAQYHVLDGNKILLNTGDDVLIVNPIAFKHKPHSLGVVNQYVYDDVPVTNIFKHIVDECSQLSTKYKIPTNKVGVVVLDTSNKFPHPDIGFDVLELVSKKDKVDSHRNVVVANKKGLLQYVARVRKIHSKTSNTFSKVIDRIDKVDASTELKRAKKDKALASV